MNEAKGDLPEFLKPKAEIEKWRKARQALENDNWF
jgi:hypothetical protein